MCEVYVDHFYSVNLRFGLFLLFNDISSIVG